MGTVVRVRHLAGGGGPMAGEDATLTQQETDSRLLELEYDYGPDLLPHAAPTDDGMWRYRKLLPIELGPILYPLLVGQTPLLGAPRLRQASGIADLWLKDETRSPTGSNKDRATALVLEGAMRRNVKTVTAASTGNVAVSLAVGAAAAGLEAVIFVPAAVHDGKLQLMLLAGAIVFRVEEGYEAAFRLSRAAARAFGWLDRNTGVNPWTVEAKKTVAFELWEQLGRVLPDVVLIPVGDGTTLTAIAKGFRELLACGVADHVPRLIGVQAQGCQPIKRAWEGHSAANALAATIADGIAVVDGINATTALREVRASKGAFVAVSDPAMLEAIQILASQAGIVAEPAAAASYAGLEAALQSGLVCPTERVVLLVTGTGLKTPQHLQPSGVAFTIRANLEEVLDSMQRD